MAKTIDIGSSTLTRKTGTIVPYIFDKDTSYRVVSNIGTEIIRTDIGSPLDRPRNFRMAYSTIANVYKGSDIAADYRSPSTKGINLLVQLTETWLSTDSANVAYEVQLPVSAHIVLKLPANADISATNVQGLIDRLVGGLYDQTANLDTTTLSALMRGSVK